MSSVFAARVSWKANGVRVFGTLDHHDGDVIVCRRGSRLVRVPKKNVTFESQ